MAAQRAPCQRRVADDDAYRKEDVDRIQIVEPDAEIGRALDLEEHDVTDDRGKRDPEQHNGGDAGDDGAHAARSGAHRAIENVEADFIALAQYKDGAPQRAPDPGDQARLFGPAE